MKEIVQLLPIWNVILSILRSQIDFYTNEMILGSQNWQDYISNRCVYHLFKSDLCLDLSIFRSLNHCHSTEIDLGSQNWQDYISNRCTYISLIQVRYVWCLGKNQLSKTMLGNPNDISNIFRLVQYLFYFKLYILTSNQYSIHLYVICCSGNIDFKIMT